MKYLKWVDVLLAKYNRAMVPLRFDYPHFHQRKNLRELDIIKVVASVRRGKIDYKNCRPDNAIFFKKYFGKENETYTVCVFIFNDYWEVQTAWIDQGRK